MMLGWTPTVPQEVTPSVVSIRTRTVALVPSAESSTLTR